MYPHHCVRSASPRPAGPERLALAGVCFAVVHEADESIGLELCSHRGGDFRLVVGTGLHEIAQSTKASGEKNSDSNEGDEKILNGLHTLYICRIPSDL